MTDTEERPYPKEILTLEKAAEYLQEADYWVEELLLTGELESLSIEDLDKYLANAQTQEIDL